ncbi:MAG: hypothetical protein CM15mP8_2350 [Methanobacteriota archaeon]|nr:MAG: hypothetical protein CM15mP8_2350 [Euryarchaeota archaeon]
MLGGETETQMLSFAGLVCSVRDDYLGGIHGLKMAKSVVKIV